MERAIEIEKTTNVVESINVILDALYEAASYVGIEASCDAEAA